MSPQHAPAAPASCVPCAGAPCLAPLIHREAALTDADRAAIRTHAQGRAARQARQRADGAPRHIVVNPFPRGTRRNVPWTSHFLEEQLRLEISAEVPA